MSAFGHRFGPARDENGDEAVNADGCRGHLRHSSRRKSVKLSFHRPSAGHRCWRWAVAVASSQPWWRISQARSTRPVRLAPPWQWTTVGPALGEEGVDRGDRCRRRRSQVEVVVGFVVDQVHLAAQPVVGEAIPDPTQRDDRPVLGDVAGALRGRRRTALARSRSGRRAGRVADPVLRDAPTSCERETLEVGEAVRARPVGGGDVSVEVRGPPARDGLDAVDRAGQASGDGGDRVGVTAEVDRGDHGVGERVVVAHRPHCLGEAGPHRAVGQGRCRPASTSR